jgi:hypothetical protein
MKLTATHAAQYAGLATGAKPRGVSLVELINLAGTYFAGLHPWRFYEAQAFTLNLRGDFDITGATWGNVAQTITKVGAFADYDWLTGDLFDLTGGTGLTPGLYVIDEKVSDDVLHLATNAGPNAVDLAGTVTIDQPSLVAFPQNIEEILGIDAVSSTFTHSAGYLSKQELASLKTQAWDAVTPGKYFLTDLWIPTDGELVRWLEVYPTPTEQAVDYFRVYARTTWVDLDSDSEPIAVPRYAQPLFLEVVRAFARAYMNPETQPLDEELARVARSGVLEAALRTDSTFLPSLGVLGPGAASRTGGVIDLLTNPVGGPVSP